MYSWIAFLAASMVIIYISRHSLFKPRSHGFYRFFAWECIAGLFALNIQYWFRTPLAWHQIISWILLVASIVSLVLGVRSLVTGGKPVEEREGDPNLLAFEKTTKVVTSGNYRYIRHPLYSSLLLLTWGIFFKLPGMAAFILALAASVLLAATARADERECIAFFGAEYQTYMQRTKMFIPFIV